MTVPSRSESPKGTDPHEEARWHRRALGVLGLVLVLRVAYLALGLTDLSPDEAYYWHWSRELDWCYYSKPPMVAWIMAGASWLLGASTFTVRLAAPVLSTLALLGVYLLGRRLFGARAGLLAVLAMVLAPGSAALGLLLTIDPPTIASWSFALLLLHGALERPERTGRWAAAGLMVCLGLLSKPVVLAFPGLLLLWLLLRDRRLLATPGPWVCLLVSATAFVPILWWNSQNDWITFGHAADHFTPGEEKPLLDPRHFLEFVGLQAGLVTPVTFVLLVAVLGGLLLRLPRVARSTAFLVVFSAVPLAGILLLSLKQRVHGNWAAPFYLSGVVVLGAWAAGRLDVSPRVDRMRRAFRPGLYLGAALLLLTLVVPLALRATSFGGTRKDPTFRVRGWEEVGLEVGRRIEALPDPRRTFVVGSRRQYVSEIVFYAPGHPPSFRVPRARIESQYELWGGPRGYEGWDALIVTDADQAPPPEVAAAFEEVVAQEPIHVPLGAGGGRTLAVHLGRNLRAWPHPARDRGRGE